MDDGVGLPGEQQLLDLVNVLVDRRRGPGVPDETPVVTLWAPRGCGLAEAVRRLGRPDVVRTTAPVVVVESGQLVKYRSHEVLLLLTWLLSGRRAGFGRLTFPRFFLGLTVVRSRDVQDGPDGARDALIRQLVRERPVLRKLLGATAAALGATLGVPGIGDAVGRVVEAVFPVAGRLGAKWSRPVRWYVDAPTGLRTTIADDQLVRLAWLERNGHHDTVEDVLVAAFLADIAAMLDNEWRLGRPGHRPLVLFPTPGPAVTTFLAMLEARRSADPCSSVAVVAASDRRIDGPVVAAGDWTTARLVEASLETWGRRRDSDPGWAGRYPLQTGTAPADVSDADDGVGSCDMTFAPRLAHGHTGGLVAASNVVATGTVTGDPREVFLTTVPNAGPLDEQVLDLVLQGWPGLRTAVVRLAMLRDVSPTRFGVLAGSGLTIGTVKELSRFLATDMWVLRAPGKDPRLHPFARRAIAHRVGRDAVAAVGWEWHEALADASDDTADGVVTRQYHRLALGRITQVADHLAGRLGAGPPADGAVAPDVETWYAELLAITRAPVRVPARGATASDALSAMLSEQPPSAQDVVQPRLVAALQLHSDVLGDPCHELCLLIAEELSYTALRASIPRAVAHLLERAEGFRLHANRQTGVLS